MDRDMALALRMQLEFDEEYFQTQKKKSFLDVNEKMSDPKISVIDPSLEYTDPTPDLQRMFVNFDKRFFWSSLGSVEVVWSPRLTSSAGVCQYYSRSGATTIRLSLPLLKLRPRKDLVETLLHEMIHAYLFVTKNNRDRDGHGPEFQSHMSRINKCAGTNITIYHNFHAEVNEYKTHWWRCNGPCQHQKPFYGMVRRAMNRAPGPTDFWFADHQRHCGGIFVKVKEPEKFKSKQKSTEKDKQGNSFNKVKTLQNYFKKVDSPSASAVPGVHGFGISSNKKRGTSPLTNGGMSTSTKASSEGTFKTKNGSTFTATKGGSYTVTVKPNTSTKGVSPAATKTNAGTSKTTNNGVSSSSVTTFSDLNGKVDVKSQEKKSSAQSIVPFSGKGHTMGKTTAPVSDKPWLKRFHTNSSSSSSSSSSNGANDNNPGIAKYLSSASASSVNISKKLKVCDSKENSKVKGHVTICTVACPVCNKSVNTTEINQHLDLCLNYASLAAEKAAEVDRCICCNRLLGNESDATALCSVCLPNASVEGLGGPDVEDDDCPIRCPMCEEEMRNSDLERHLELCISGVLEGNESQICDDGDDDITVLN